jgi:hypothetical protein
MRGTSSIHPPDETCSRSPERARLRINCTENSGFMNTESVRILLQVTGPNAVTENDFMRWENWTKSARWCRGDKRAAECHDGRREHVSRAKPPYPYLQLATRLLVFQMQLPNRSNPIH